VEVADDAHHRKGGFPGEEAEGPDSCLAHAWATAAPAITSFIPSDPLVASGSGTTLMPVFVNSTGSEDNGLGVLTSGMTRT